VGALLNAVPTLLDAEGISGEALAWRLCAVVAVLVLIICVWQGYELVQRRRQRRAAEAERATATALPVPQFHAGQIVTDTPVRKAPAPVVFMEPEFHAERSGNDAASRL
jgi:hypothetical protein